MVKRLLLPFGFGLGTSKEARLIQRSILENRMAGLGKTAKRRFSPNWFCY